MPRPLALYVVIGLIAATGARASENIVWPSANEELLHSARLWEARERGDLAQLALKKLVAARPDSPQALLLLGELDLRLNIFAESAQVESELARRFMGSEAANTFAAEYRIATRDRLQFASIRRMVEIGHGAEARAALERLFPQGPPGGVLGIEYYLLLASTPNGLTPAYEGVRRLADRQPDDPRYQLALARLLVKQRDTASEGVALLERLARRDDVRTEDADRLLASGLLRLGPERAPTASLRAYLARHPDDVEVTALRSSQERANEERALLLPETRAGALPRLQQRLAKDLSSGNLSSQSRREALRWLDRSRASLENHREALAASELRAALALSRGDYESAIPIAQELAVLGSDTEAGELVASAAALDPQSSWLFETRMRWLIEHGQISSALAQLRARPLGRTWTAESRDGLLARAFEERASAQAQEGKMDAAIADREAALQLTPLDPWLRYRLAEDYGSRGDWDRGRQLMSAGASLAPASPDMRYAQALYLSHTEDFAAAATAIDAIDPARRSENMNALRDRMRVALARAEAKRLKDRGDLEGARARLLEAEPEARRSIDRAAELAYSWIDLGSPEHGLSLVRPYLQGPGANDPEVLLVWAQVLNSAEDNERMGPVLAQLHTIPRLTEAQQGDVRRLQRALDLRLVRHLERGRKFEEAAQRLDAMIAREPHDRQLRIARADLDLASGHARSARDRYASLAAEDPDDLDTRLSYIRALTETGDIALARTQLRAVEQKLAADDDELRITLARRQLALGEAGKALRSLRPLLARAPARTDVLMLAGRAELAQRHFAQARGYFDDAARTATGADILAARRESEDIEQRLESSVAAGLIFRHQPGAAGMSQIDALTIPSAWLIARNYESRFTARADAVILDAGRWGGAGQAMPLIGTLPTSGSAGPPKYADDRQTGLSPAVGYQTDSLSLDIGSTPLGFLLTNIVGGIEWTPTWHSADLTLGLARRAVTSSELSYAGLRDPVTGAPWGGVVQSGPYAGVGIYRENYDISGSVQWSQLSGTRVLDNQFAGVRVSTSRTFLARPEMRADAGLTVNYWNYSHNLSNYTFGNGGYYSPQSYVSVATPIELIGHRAAWSYKLRASISFSVSQVRDAAFYPNDATLQAAAARSTLPDGYSTPYFSGYHSSGFGFSAYGAAERQISSTVVAGFMVSIDRTDFYHPSTVEIYARHAFGARSTAIALPPRPTRPYNP